MLNQRKFLVIIFAFIFTISSSLQDIYLHNPRGSNNRLNERSATRKNNNRMFDSQNNARGGYNLGDALSEPFTTENEQYQMSGLTGSSFLDIEWTSQHGCGGGGDSSNDPYKVDCTFILQYKCQQTNLEPKNFETNLDRIRDGLNTNTQDYKNMDDDSQEANIQRKKNTVSLERGLHESWEWYDNCNYRERNNGLFVADQILRNNEKGFSSAIFTRQNPNGQRSGYECPEEREYFPYWHPNSGWKDIAVLTSNTSFCDYFRKESFNLKTKHMCIEYYDNNSQKHWSRWNNQQDCLKNNGKWIEFYNYLEKANQFKDQNSCERNQNRKWAIPFDSIDINQKECLILLNEPLCQKTERVRSNHLGNSQNGKHQGFRWKLPYFPSKNLQTCVFRIRYNISSKDFDYFKTDAKLNNENSPIKNDPLVNIGSKNQALKLAINTAQVGRVFQDRSHSFLLMPRTELIGDNVNIYNLNVKGKRGNIVQTYPGVEYDFVPNDLTLNTQDYLHIQWTGSNTHNNGNPGGDGQTGDAGQGKTGTDRSNLVEINDLNENYPLPYEINQLWKDISLIGFVNENITRDNNQFLIKLENSNDSNKDLAVYLSSSGYYQCISENTCKKNLNQTTVLNADLNNAPASVGGAIIKFNKPNKIYYYISSRNNNFSNRSQKGKIQIN